MGSLVADGGVGAVSGQHDRGVGKRKQQVVDRVDDGGEGRSRELGGTGSAGEQRVAREQKRCVGHVKRDRAGGVPRVVDGVQPKASDFDHVVVIHEYVVANVLEHWCIEFGDGHLVTGFAHGGHGLNEIVVAVRFENTPNPEPFAESEQLLVLVGRVDEHCVTGLLAANDEDVVVVGAHDQTMDFHR